ncbi:TonB-dependent receptor [Aggregatibacter kilianii]|jgi:pesticin receptor|uniref:TonB-dependent receptor n=1 Tax=Aggregatibacter kilianii TaxID=2025884 RepID=UPI000D6428F9|nr:TonB-dependent receptor [Aggregatibacter kilianii]
MSVKTRYYFTGLALCLFTPVLMAETELDPIVVSGKRVEKLDQFNGSVSVADRQTLSDKHILNSYHLDRIFPNLHIASASSRLFPTLSLRGVTSANDFYTPAVTLYVDGVPQLPVTAMQSLLNVERVELLKGSQGTLYGKSAIGGVLNVISQEPSNQTKGSIQAGLGNKHAYNLQGNISGALIKDLLYGTLSLSGDNQAGGITSHYVSDKTLGGMRNRAVNAGLLLAPSLQPWKVRLNFTQDRSFGKQYAFVDFTKEERNAISIDPNILPYIKFRQGRDLKALSLSTEYNFTNSKLSLIISHQKASLDNFIPYFSFYGSQPEEWKQNTQELRWQTTGENNQIDAVLGVYHQALKRDRIYQFWGNIPQAPVAYTNISSHHNTSDYAAYANVIWHATAAFDLGGGIRYGRDHAKVNYWGTTQGNNQKTKSIVLGNLTAGWQITPNLRWYANIAQGYKPHGYNFAPTNMEDAKGFQQEKSTSYETGMRFRSDSLLANFAIYQIRSRNIQLYDGTPPVQFIHNVGNSRSQGVELDVNWQPIKQLEVGFAGFVNQAKFTRYDATQHCADCNHNRVPFSPKYGASLTLTGNIVLGEQLIRPSVSVKRVGAHYFDVENKLRQNAYTLLDAQVSYSPLAHTELQFYVHNLTDKYYRTYAFNNVANYAQPGVGRTFGVNVKYEF